MEIFWKQIIYTLVIMEPLRSLLALICLLEVEKDLRLWGNPVWAKARFASY
jgi:hypothetical protein